MKLAVLFLLAALAASADQVTLKNGDRVTGAIQKKDGDTLSVKSDLMGVVTIPWDQVADINSTAPLNVVLADRTVQSTLETANGQIRLSGSEQPVAPAAIVALRDGPEQAAYERMLHPNWLQLWKGTATLGLAGAKGNAETSTFTLSSNVERATRHDVTSLYFNMVKASARANGVNSDTAQALRGGWKYSRHLSARIDLDAFNDYEYDRFQSLDLRFVVGGGLGYRVWKSERGGLTLQGGADYDHDKFSPAAPAPAYSKSFADAYWGDDFGYRLNAATSITQTFRMFNNLSDTGAYRMNADFTANTKLLKWLVWNISLIDRYTNTPVAGLKTNDLIYSTGLGATFGH
jgi:putative salt-induced outer membrane protein YdiY